MGILIMPAEKKTAEEKKTPEFLAKDYLIAKAKLVESDVEQLTKYLKGDGADKPASETNIIRGHLNNLKAELSIINTRISRFK